MKWNVFYFHLLLLTIWLLSRSHRHLPQQWNDNGSTNIQLRFESFALQLVCHGLFLCLFYQFYGSKHEITNRSRNTNWFWVKSVGYKSGARFKGPFQFEIVPQTFVTNFETPQNEDKLSDLRNFGLLGKVRVRSGFNESPVSASKSVDHRIRFYGQLNHSIGLSIADYPGQCYDRQKEEPIPLGTHLTHCDGCYRVICNGDFSIDWATWDLFLCC